MFSFLIPLFMGGEGGGGEKEAGMVIVKMETLPSLFCLPFAFPTKGMIIICQFCFKASKYLRLNVLHLCQNPYTFLHQDPSPCQLKNA